ADLAVCFLRIMTENDPVPGSEKIDWSLGLGASGRVIRAVQGRVAFNPKMHVPSTAKRRALQTGGDGCRPSSQ
ncbi:hypothetical protein, partial [Mesorhizobium sp. B2-6-4]|uniref:hypothetical protein n=1 Tax=Mesorhizobium sp. B2-6-4 TaxID=2589913 RepID=UPI001AEEF73F